MGYNLRIGEAVLEYDEDCMKIDCEIVRHEDAPAHGDPTDFESQRWPSYSAWHESMEKLGLLDVMFNGRNGGNGSFDRNGKTRSPLLEVHPGETPVTIEHVEEVEEKLAVYKAKHPDHRAEYPPPKPDAKPIVEGSSLYREEDYVTDPTYDAALCRGEWLAYWLRWAIDNCKKPVFVNT